MKTEKLLTMLALAALPFLAGCASPSEKIRRSIRTDVPVNRQDVSAAIAEGESPWALHAGEETFSLFEYATGKNDTGLIYGDLIDSCLSNKSLSPELSEAQCVAYVERVFASLSADKNSVDELSVCEKIWNEGLALSAKPKLEAKQKQIEEERKRLAEEQERLEKERREKARLEALKEMERVEKQLIRRRLLQEIFPSEQKLSEEERSRGWTLLETFGEEQMPALAEKCKTARRNYLEAEANLESLTAALEEEGTDIGINKEIVRYAAENQVPVSEVKKNLKSEVVPKVNDVFLAASMRALDLAADYWFLRHELTDFYSQFKIGAITSDELAAADGELADRL